MRIRNSLFHPLLSLSLLGFTAPTWAAEPARFTLPRASFTAAGPVAVALDQFDANAWLDAVTANRGAVSRSFLLGNGTGFFPFRLDLALATNCAPNSIATGDFDGNGFTDVATVCDDRLSMLFLGDEALQAATSKDSLAGERDLHGIATGRFDPDAALDLVLLSDARRGAILVRYAPGGVIQATLFTLATAPTDVAAEELTNDSHMDFVTVEANGTVTLFPGKGDGTFYARKHFTAPEGANRVALADATGDGFKDILVAGPDFVAVLPGNNNGEFAAAITSPTLYNATAFVASDFNGDGLTDVAVASDSAPGIQLLLNQGDGTFAQSQFGFSFTPISALAVGDFNDDGKPDLLAAEQALNLVTVRLNTTGASVNEEPSSDEPRYDMNTSGTNLSAVR
ncbi:MAG: VCBS repeat-containing protein [Myxococcaceae bacterium]|nr:MAG: VCBS repeat-containing protein [Myxococcaceae bacterium]